MASREVELDVIWLCNEHHLGLNGMRAQLLISPKQASSTNKRKQVAGGQTIDI